MEEEYEGSAAPSREDDDEHAGLNHYFLSYVRYDGEMVEEGIWARNHQAAIRVARKRGLERLLSLERESSHSGHHARNPMTSHLLLPLFVALTLTACVVLLFAWRRGLL